MERCPVCRARRGEQIQCKRCDTDLSTLVYIDKLAEKWERYAVQQLVDGNLEQAQHAIAQVLKLQKRPLAQVLRRFIEARKIRRFEILNSKFTVRGSRFKGRG